MASASFSSGVLEASSGSRFILGVSLWAAAGPASNAIATAAQKILMRMLPGICALYTTARTAPPSTPARDQRGSGSIYRRSDLQDLGDCCQSSQNGPHLVQPLSSS